MWAVQPRFERDLPAFVRRAADLGFEAIEINHSMNANQVAAIRSQLALESGMPVTAVHAPAPLQWHPRRGWNRDLNLAATDEEERGLAVGDTQRSIELAADLGAPLVVVHLGQVGRHELTGERHLRRLHNHGEMAGEEWQHATDKAAEQRSTMAAPYLAQARRSLDELVNTAQTAGVTLGLECRLHYHQIPLPEEAAELLAAHPRHVVGYWHDVGHAEVMHRLGLIALDSWFELLCDRLMGVHLHDVRGLRDHCAPGNGDVDFAALAAHIPPGAARTLEIDEQEPDADVASGIALLRNAGVVA